MQRLHAKELLPTDLAHFEGLDEWTPIAGLPPGVMQAALEQAPSALQQKAADDPLAPAATVPLYHGVPTWRFVVMYLMTLGLYSVYWVYKSWNFIKKRDGSNIWPFWRGVFTPVWILGLAQDIEKTEGIDPKKSRAAGIAAAFFLLFLAENKLPDPYWMIGLLAVIPLGMLNHSVLQANRAQLGASFRPRGLGIRHFLLGLVFGPLIGMAVLESVGIVPITAIQTGDEMNETMHVQFLRDAEIIEPDETITYFYSGGVFSIKGEGAGPYPSRTRYVH